MSEWLVGAYGPDMQGSARGIARLRSKDDGSLEVVEGFLIEAPSPAFLARDGDRVLAALEGERAVLELGGARWPSGGQWPCHVGVYGDSVVVANYFDGTLGLRSGQVVAPAPGAGPHAAQDGPHAHSTVEIAAGVILSADLGADRVGIHWLVDGVLSRTGYAALPAGTGPRDLLVVGSLLYILGEHSRTVTVAEWRDGSLEIGVSYAIAGAEATDQGAGLVHSDGVLYTLLRGSNQLAAMRIAGSGLEALGAVSTRGDWPRHLAVDGQLLHVANQRSGSVTTFRTAVDALPQPVGEPCLTPSPTYLLLD